MKKNTDQPQSKSIDKDVRELVIARLKASSADFKISIGGEGEFSREDMIKSVEEGTDTGQKIIDIQMDYLRDLASGKIYQDGQNS